MKELQQIEANPDNSLLVVIDIQKEQNMRGGGLPEPNAERSTREAIVPTVRGLLDRAREAEVRVIHVQSVRNHVEPEFTVFEYNPILKIGTWNSEFIEEVAPLPGEIVVRKWCHDPWYETDLERVLKGLVPDPTKVQVLVAGGGGTGCYFFGVKGFYVRNYRTVAVVDAIYGGPTVTTNHFSRTSYPTFPNVSLSRSDLIEFSKAPETVAAGR